MLFRVIVFGKTKGNTKHVETKHHGALAPDPAAAAVFLRLERETES